MRLVIFATVVLVVTTQPDIHRPDAAGWFLILLVGLFCASLDLTASVRRSNIAVKEAIEAAAKITESMRK